MKCQAHTFRLSPTTSTNYEVETSEDLRRILNEVLASPNDLSPVTIYLQEGCTFRFERTYEVSDSIRPITLKGRGEGIQRPKIVGRRLLTIRAGKVNLNNPDSQTNRRFGLEVWCNGVTVKSLVATFNKIIINTSDEQNKPDIIFNAHDKEHHIISCTITKSKNTYQSGNELTGLICNDSFLYIYYNWICHRFLVEDVSYDTGQTTCSLRYYMSNSGDQMPLGNCTVELRNYVNPQVRTPHIVNNISERTISINGISAEAADVPTTETLFLIRRCANITFDNIDFADCAIDDITKGRKQQAEELSGGSVQLFGCQNIRINNCTFEHIYGYCIYVHKDSSLGPDILSEHIRIENNVVTDTYGGGFFIACGQDHVIRNNLIDSFGLYLPGAVGVIIQNASHNSIVHNTICYGYYSGISVGWSWGYFEPQSTDNYIAYNHIYKLLQEKLNDGAGIYTLGDSPGTIIEHNFIHDIYSKKDGDAAGIYLDEGSSHILAQYNVVCRCNVGFHLHYGASNEVCHNLFAESKDYTLKISQDEKHLQCYFHNNIFQQQIDDTDKSSTSYKPLICHPIGTFYMSHNLSNSSQTNDILTARCQGKIKDLHVGDISFDCSNRMEPINFAPEFISNVNIDHFHINMMPDANISRITTRMFKTFNIEDYGYKEP